MNKSSLFGISDLASRFCCVFTLGILAKALGTELYASWGLLLGLQLLISNITSLGFSTAMQRLLPALQMKQQNYFLFVSIILNFLLNFIVTLGLLIFSNKILNIYTIELNMQKIVYILGANSFIICIENLIDVFLKIKEHLKRYQFYLLVKTGTELLCLFYFFKFSVFKLESIDKLLLYLICLFSVKLLLYFVLLVKYVQNIDFIRDLKLKTFVAYGIPTVIASLALWCFGNLDRVLLINYMSFDELGGYMFGANVATYVNYAGVVVVPLFLPRLSKLFDKKLEQAELKRFFNNHVLNMIIIIGGFWLMLAIFHENLILLTAGKNFIHASVALFFMSLYFGIDQIIGLWCYVFHLKKKPHYITALRICYLVFFISGLFIALQFVKSSYIPLVILFIGIIYNALIYYFAQKLYPLKISKKNIFALLSFLSLSMLLYRFKLLSVGWPVKMFTFLLIISFLTVCFFRINAKNERQYSGLVKV